MGITIVGLGPGHGRYLTREAWDVLTNASEILLRTARHPTVADLPASVTTRSFDHIYDTTERFEDVYATIVNTIIEQTATGEVIYAVPGHPLMGESTVTALLAKAKEVNLPVRIVDGISFVEPMITAVSLDALDGLQIFDAIDIAARQYPPLDPDTPALIGQVYNKLLASELKLVLMMAYPEEHPVKLVHAAGTEQEIIEEMPLYEMDRSLHIDHLTSMFVPPLPRPSSLNVLADTVAVLRSPGGCPWDQEQTPQSMRQGFLEEFGEVLAALDADDPENLREELGDLLYHI
ncbi:MAG: nucleoside triphosphate pyrophosphohydrolase, partial [Candidatus Thermofonsia bacterium]